MKRRSMLAAAAGMAAGVPLLGRPSAASAQPPLNTVSVDLAAPVGPFPFGLGRQLSAIPRNWNYGPDTYANLEALRLQRVRVWLRFTYSWDQGTGNPAYANEYSYLDTYHARAGTLLVNWRTDYDPLVTGGTWTAEQLFAATRDMLAHYKQRHPKIEYIEVENEDIWQVDDAPFYYPKYRLMYRVVNAVNALGLPGPTLKVGGPTLDIFSELRLGAFLDLYRADGDPGKRLDFVSYHQYLINTGAGDWTVTKLRPAMVADERDRLDALLAARGLPSVPALITEIGIFPGTRESSLGFAADLHIQAAGVASLHYFYAGQRDVVPFDWTISHPENSRKNLFVTTANGVPRPYYNALRALSMLPATRFRASSDTLSADGIGVYGLAGAEPDRVAVATWNYQWTRPDSYDSRIVISNFSGRFRTSDVLVTRYRIPNDVPTGDLLLVEQFVIGPRTAGTYYAQTLPMRPNELRLLVLTPIDGQRR